MKKVCKIFFIELILIKFGLFNNKIKRRTGDETICTLTRKKSQDPYPSLSKCYKYNNEACCLSVHDEYISQYISNLLSTSCIRKYASFENLMCLGCHPLESQFIDKSQRKIRLCKEFALSLWGAGSVEDLDKPTKVFDNCGFKKSSTLKNLTDENYIIPSETFQNFSNFFYYINIPFFENYKIEIQDNTDNFCYNQSHLLSNKLFKIIFYFIYFIFF